MGQNMYLTQRILVQQLLASNKTIQHIQNWIES